MKSDVNTDKLIADIIEKIVDRRAEKEDIIRLLEISFGLSDFVNKIEVPMIVSQPIVSAYEGQHVLANVIYNAQIVNINEEEVIRLCKGESSLLGCIFNSFGHEITHLYRYIIGENIEFEKISYQQIEDLFEFMGIKNDNGAIFGPIIQGHYLSQMEEEAARQGGDLFARNLFEYILNNEFVKGKYREYIENEWSFYLEYICNQNSANDALINAYKTLVEWLASIDISAFIDSEKRCETEREKEMLRFTVEVRCDGMEQLRISQDFVKSILPPGSNVVRKCLLDFINGNKFSIKNRDNLRETIVSALLLEDTPREVFVKDFAYLLTSEQIKYLYKTLAEKDISKIDSPLFECYFNEIDNGKEMIAQACIEAYASCKILGASKETLETLKEKIRSLRYCSDLSPEVKERLQGIDFKSKKI